MGEIHQNTNVKGCYQCIHKRVSKPIDPFSGITIWTPELMARKIKWDEEQRDLILKEKMQYDTNPESYFNYEPISLPWCAYWTDEEGGSEFDPVSGETRKLYVLCGKAYKNCTKFKAE